MSKQRIEEVAAMCGPCGHRFYGPHPMLGYCCEPWSWRRPSKEERLEWLKWCKQDLQRRISEIDREIERIGAQETTE